MTKVNDEAGTTVTLTFKVERALFARVQKTDLPVDAQALAKHPDVLEDLFIYGLQQRVNDYANRAGRNGSVQDKIDCGSTLIADLQNGVQAMRRTRASSADDFEVLALKNAKTEILNMFKMQTGYSKIGDIVSQSAPAAAFFKHGSVGYVWDDAKVVAFMKASPVDWEGEAQKELDRLAARQSSLAELLLGEVSDDDSDSDD